MYDALFNMENEPPESWEEMKKQISSATFTTQTPREGAVEQGASESCRSCGSFRKCVPLSLTVGVQRVKSDSVDDASI